MAQQVDELRVAQLERSKPRRRTFFWRREPAPASGRRPRVLDSSAVVPSLRFGDG